MKIDIYKSTKNGTKYLSVPAGTDVKKYKFPPNIDPDLLSLLPFKTSLDIKEEDNRVAIDSRQVINEINKNGYAIHGAKIEVRRSIGR